MKLRTILLLTSLFTSLAIADPHPGDNPSGGATNKDGSYVTGVLSSVFDPGAAAEGDPTQVPIPNNLFFADTKDLTINIPGLDESNKADPLVAMNALDGFSPTENWITSFVDIDGAPGQIDPDSVLPGLSVRMFQVTTHPASYAVVTGVIRELTPGIDFWAAAGPGGTLAIIPLKPLAEFSDYMAVLTNDITDTAGNNATPSQTYYFTKSDTPWFEDGQSTTPFLDDETAFGAEQLRQLTLAMEAAAASQGVNPDDIILAWTAHTQGVKRTLKELRAITQPAPVLAAKTPFDTSITGTPGFADIVIGVITLPYYGGIPSPTGNPAAQLTDNWQAAPGNYFPPFDQAPLDPTSTHVTTANPMPELTGMVTVPFIMGVPNAKSGNSKPEDGWPVMMYGHGITRNRTDAIALFDSAALAGYAMIAIDFPLHGVVPGEITPPELEAFYIENTPFGAIADERHFEADWFNNDTQEFGPDGKTDPSGLTFFNLNNLITARDNMRQAQTDMSVLAASLQNIDIDGDQVPDLNPFNVGFTSSSYGVFIGTAFAAVEPIVSRAYFNAGGAIFVRTGVAGAFGSLVNALLASQGVFPGTPEYELFLLVAQSAVGAADPASWASELSLQKPVLHNTVFNDDTVPNFVGPATPMGGNIGLNNLLGLTDFDSTQINPEGVRGHAMYLPPAFHTSLFRPINPDTGAFLLHITLDMQTQMSSFISTGGQAVQVNQPSLLVPVIDTAELLGGAPVTKSGKKKKSKSDRRQRLDRFELKPNLGKGGQ